MPNQICLRRELEIARLKPLGKRAAGPALLAELRLKNHISITSFTQVYPHISVEGGSHPAWLRRRWSLVSISIVDTTW